MKILIVDDEQLARERIREMLKSETRIGSISEAANGGQAIESVLAERPDLVFLDIQMPDLDGFKTLETLGAQICAQIPAIIFVTAYDQFALRAFEFHALDYLLKPFDRRRFADALQRAKTQILNRRTDLEPDRRIVDLLEKISEKREYLEWLTVKKDERIVLLKVLDLHWVEAQGNYVLLKFINGSELLRETMDHLEAQLDPRIFVRIHRSTIVNLNQIKELQVWSRGEYRVVTQSGKTFTLSRGYRNRFDIIFKKRLS